MIRYISTGSRCTSPRSTVLRRFRSGHPQSPSRAAHRLSGAWCGVCSRAATLLTPPTCLRHQEAAQPVPPVPLAQRVSLVFRVHQERLDRPERLGTQALLVPQAPQEALLAPLGRQDRLAPLAPLGLPPRSLGRLGLLVALVRLVPLVPLDRSVAPLDRPAPQGLQVRPTTRDSFLPRWQVRPTPWLTT